MMREYGSRKQIDKKAGQNGQPTLFRGRVMSNESVGWQFFEDGQWWTGFDTNNHRKNTEEAGIPVRDVYVRSDCAVQERMNELERLLGQAQGMVNGATDEWHDRVTKVLSKNQT